MLRKHRKLFVIPWIILLLVSCGKDKPSDSMAKEEISENVENPAQSNSEQCAQTVLNEFLSCTLQQAEEFEAAALEARASIEAEADGEVGLAQRDKELREYLVKRFGSFLSDECIEELAKERTFYKMIALAKSLDADMEVDEIEITKRSDEEECYTFSANIKTSAGDLAADAQGTISLEEDGGEWKAVKITLNMDM